MTRKQFLSAPKLQSLSILSNRILHNCVLTKKIVDHCADMGISHYRVSSNIFPLITDAHLAITYEDLPHIEEIKDALSKTRNNKVTMSSHPDMFNVLSSYSQDVVNKSIKELNHQAYILDLMGLPQNYSAPMCLHLNLSPDIKRENLASYVDRFKTSLSLCSPSVQKRLVLENEDKGFWNCGNLYDSFGKFIPLVYDNLHDSCNPSAADHSLLMRLFKLTWGSYTPVMHWSEGTTEKPRSHAEFASHVPRVVSMNQDCIWEFELKGKDQAILQILKKDLALVA
jgi:UV DNA damage endonuclease